MQSVDADFLKTEKSVCVGCLGNVMSRKLRTLLHLTSCTWQLKKSNAVPSVPPTAEFVELGVVLNAIVRFFHLR